MLQELNGEHNTLRREGVKKEEEKKLKLLRINRHGNTARLAATLA